MICKITMKTILIFLLLLLPIGLSAQNKPTEPSKKDSETKTNELQEVKIISLTEEQKEVLKVKNNINPVTIITAKQLENRAGNLNEVLARQAGVQVRSSGGLGSEARISIRGLEGKRVQVFIDGNALNTPDGSFGINDLPVQVIERIEIYKGSVPAYLGGDGLGSAVNVVTRHRDMSYIDANISRQSYNTESMGLILKKTFYKQGIEIGGGIFSTKSDNDYSFLSPYQPDLIIKRDHDKFKSVLGGLSIRFHKLWFDEIEIETAFVNNDKQIQGIQKNIQKAESESNAKVLALTLVKKRFFYDKLNFRFSLLLGDFNAKFKDLSFYSYNWDGSRTPSTLGQGELGIGPNLSTSIQKEIRQRLNLDYAINEKFNLNLNSAFRYGSFDPKDDVGNAYAGKNLFNYPANLTNSVTGLTFDSNFFNNKLLFSTAGKYYSNYIEGYNTSIYLTDTPDKISNNTGIFGYNFGFRYRFSESFLVKASHEKGVRLPNNAEFFGDGILITPAIFLKPEVAYNSSLGLIFDKTYRNEKRLQIDVNGFYMNVEELIQLSGNGLSLGYVNFAKARIVGADMDIKADITKTLFASCNATYQILTDTNEFIPATQNVPNPTYNLKIPNTPQLFANWNLEFHKDNWLCKNSKTRIIYDGSFTDEFNYGFKISIYDNFVIPAYVSHTLSFEQSFQDNRYTVSAEVNNLTDQEILNNYNLPLPGRTFRIKLRYLFLSKNKHHH